MTYWLPLPGSHYPKISISVFNRENTGNKLSLARRNFSRNGITPNENKVFRDFHFPAAIQEQGIDGLGNFPILNRQARLYIMF